MSEDDRVQFKLMVPATLKARLEEVASANRRSLSAEMIARLEATLGRPTGDDEYLSVDDLRNEIDLLRWRIAMWEPLILQATPEELAALQKRLVETIEALDIPEFRKPIAAISPPLRDLKEFPSLKSVMSFFEKIRRVGQQQQNHELPSEE
ncbi:MULTISPECIES: Arc family DNA-binding protein [unclassified Neorhizobium]|uniref:Arc family DNA-binding protein n=1 Tax=unclassified Neorhizobium TaxID=2629175 RepID=UPI001FF25262|nr:MULTISPECIES: Arc family DNA-binding protein [unclassified Neorhizobium]MCJ9672916.1 Arc family DNA-binding protein [Neorhizobium sp. SHOUNA12B]MCJ9748543.1 Arc family DNA-binding protein [Neorhizobium sp. SHOUNA12A]